MGEDKRIKDLANEIDSAELQSKDATLTIAVDDPSWTGIDPARKLKLATFLASGKQNLADDVDYKAMTPNAFYLTTLSETEYGTGRAATQAELLSANSDRLVTAQNFETALLSQGSIIITDANKTTYVDSTFPAGTVNPNLVYSKLGNIVHISGELNPNIPSSAAYYQIYLKNLAMPNDAVQLQGGHATYTDGSSYYSAAVNVAKVAGSPDLLRLTIYPQRGYAFTSASTFVLGVSYIADGL